MRRRRVRLPLVACALVALGALLASCSSNGSASLTAQACRDVAKSLRLFDAAQHSSDAARAAAERASAVNELRVALAPASLAASGGGSGQALMATLSES